MLVYSDYRARKDARSIAKQVAHVVIEAETPSSTAAAKNTVRSKLARSGGSGVLSKLDDESLLLSYHASQPRHDNVTHRGGFVSCARVLLLELPQLMDAVCAYM